MRLDRSGSVCSDRRLVTPPKWSWPLHVVAKLGLCVCLLSCGDEELFAQVTTTGSGGLSDGELEVVHSPEFIDAVFRTFQPR